MGRVSVDFGGCRLLGAHRTNAFADSDLDSRYSYEHPNARDPDGNPCHFAWPR